MAWTQTDLDAIDKAIASGAVRVDYPGGGSVTYRSLADMRSVRGDIAKSVNDAAGVPAKPRRLKIYSTKDL
jgi:hypothetical protein